METEQKPKSRRVKWVCYTFDPNNIPELFPFDLNPVSDIPIRLAVEQGSIKNKRDLALFQLLTDWNGHPARSIVIAGKLEEGREIAVWIADDKEHKIDKRLLTRDQDIELTTEPAQQNQADDETESALEQITAGKPDDSFEIISSSITAQDQHIVSIREILAIPLIPTRLPSKIRISAKTPLSIKSHHLVFNKSDIHTIPKKHFPFLLSSKKKIENR